MKKPFEVIAIIGKPRDQQAIQTHKELYQWLTTLGYSVFIDDRLKEILTDIPQDHFSSLIELGKQADLAIVVGGDGNMLGAARVLSRFDISVIGVNRGNLGFLTDLNPEDFQTHLQAVLQGEYMEEERFLLEAEVHRHGQIKSHNAALNEAVLHPGKIAHMIEFEVYIDDKFAFSQRRIKLVVSPDNRGTQEVSCDGQISLPVSPGDEVIIYQSPNVLKLIHPKDYSYYSVLRSKLGWFIYPIPDYL